MSAAVQTATTPGSAKASDASIETIVPWGLLRPHHAHMELAGEVQIGDEARGAGDERRILDAGDGRANGHVRDAHR